MVPWYSQILRAVDNNALLIRHFMIALNTNTWQDGHFCRAFKMQMNCKNLKIWKKGLSTQKMNNLCVSPENY